MNSAEEISKFKEPHHNYYSPTLNRRLMGYGYDLPEKTPKKEKKWSIGSLFRRKKKDETESSSEEDNKKGFLSRRKRKPEKKKTRNKTVGTFDHVVIPRNVYSNGHDERGILSDPSVTLNTYMSRTLPKNYENPKNQQEITATEINSGSVDSVRKCRKDLAKVRAEARRQTIKQESSSDEDSQRSVSSSRFRSDESLGGFVNRRSRSARTERYFKRHSRDGENPKDYLRLSKSDAEHWRTSDDSNRSMSRSPLVPRLQQKTSYSAVSSKSPSISGLSTIPPSHGNHKSRVSNSTSNPSYKPPLSINEYNQSTRKLPNDRLTNQRSISCDANIHKNTEPEVIHAQFQIGVNNTRYRNLSMVDPRHVSAAHLRQPPPPPPRDPKRMVTNQFFENGRPNTYYFDGQTRCKSFNLPPNNNFYPPQTRKSLNPNCRSTSEDYLPKNTIQLIPRPSSTTPDVAASNRNRILKRQEFPSNNENYNYLTDKKPRSRKPIFIRPTEEDKSGTKKALDFWKQKDKEGQTQLKQTAKETKSPQMFTCQTHVQTQVFLPSVVPNDINQDQLPESVDNKTINVDTVDQNVDRLDQKSEPDVQRKSTNLEEALDELEAIYNSLRLGDEDLLERAEQREKDAAMEKLKQNAEKYPSWSTSRGTLSDSSFSYEPFDLVDSPKRKRMLKKSQTIDRRGDDMAFRKLNKKRAATINDPQSAISKVSYLQASPVFNSDMPETCHKHSNEPDVTFDDVVYRNVKYANASPKVIEQQPPFGIPVGPITPAANSDYLHAVPDNVQRPAFKPRKIPDLVKDDLAFRNLRKDSAKEPALPPLSPDDLKNNNALGHCLDLNKLKKKRAVRSLSANIGSLINKDVLNRRFERHNKSNNNDSENEFKTLTDIADAMEIARQVLREKENKISATRRAFLSDTDTNNGNNSITNSRNNFLNSLKAPFVESCTRDSNYLQAKPPRGLTPERKSPRSPKESTPIPISQFEDKCVGKEGSSNSSLDDLLTALANETRETSDRISNDFKHYEEERTKSNELNKKLSDIDAVSEQAKLCEKLLEGVVDSADLVESSKDALEQVELIESKPKESVANVVLTCDNKSKKSDNVVESDHDYENLISDTELNLDKIKTASDEKCTSPFEEHKAELIATFQELKNNVELDLAAVKTVEKDAGEESCCHVLDAFPCACVRSFTNCHNPEFYLSNCDLDHLHHTNPSDAETSSGFYSQEPSVCLEFGSNLDSLESLKSPKLVLESSKLNKNKSNKQILKNQSMICSDLPSTSGNNQGRVVRNDSRYPDSGKSCAWYRDPTTLAVACSYGIACVHQLASLDFVSILGLLFAVLSFIAALIF